MKFSFNKSKIVLIIIFGILIVLSLNFFQNKVKGFFYSLSFPIQNSLWNVGDKISDFFESISDFKNLKKENEELLLQNQELLSQIILFKEFEKENEILRKALEIGLQEEFKLILAEVSAKDVSQDSLLINKGSKDGILKDFPVISEQKTLVGRISEVYDTFSKVMLISNKESSFDAEIQEKEVSGIVKGKGALKIFLDLIPKDKEITEGDLVVSTQLGGIFPKGLLVGKIKQVQRSDIEPFQQADINPFFDIKELKTLFIIAEF